MSQSKQPPFKRGEWVKIPGFTAVGDVHSIRWHREWSKWFVQAGNLAGWADDFRPATARELRAESKRLAKRAAELSAAADAVEAKKAGKR